MGLGCAWKFTTPILCSAGDAHLELDLPDARIGGFWLDP